MLRGGWRDARTNVEGNNQRPEAIDDAGAPDRAHSPPHDAIPYEDLRKEEKAGMHIKMMMRPRVEYYVR